MKIFFIGASSLENSPDSMEAHIISAFSAMGITHEYFSYTETGIRGRINRLLETAVTDFHILKSTPIERSLLKSIKRFRPDLVLVLLGNYTAPTTIRKIREITDGAIACWCQDHMGTLGRQYILGSKFDYIFAKDPVMVDIFQRYTSTPHVHYLPEACNPGVHHPVVPTPEDRQRFSCDVTTAATLYYYRSEILETLTDFNLRIWGPVPRFYDGPLRPHASGKSVYTRDKAACFNAAKVVLNTLSPIEFGGLNARAFEVAGCGGFQLMTHTDSIARHFVPGREIETFRDLNELREKVRYYLDHDSERQAIADAGCRRAHSEHTYEHRLNEMIQIIQSNWNR